MKKNEKIEIIFLTLIVLLYFLLLKGQFSSLFYLLFILVGAFYFFPIKAFLNRNKENIFLTISSCFLISLSLIISYVSFLLEELNKTLKIILLSLIIFNLFLIYNYISSKLKSDIYIHILLSLLLVLTFFK